MGDVINTIDIVGDDNLIDSIIEDTIVELVDDSLTTISASAFRERRNLRKVVFPNVRDMLGYAFCKCELLNEVTAPLLESISTSCFEACTALDTLDFPNLKSIGLSGFSDCTNLKAVNAPNVTSMSGSAFKKCTSLNKIVLANVETLPNSAFDDCSNLEYVDLPIATDLGQYSLRSCTILKALLLRSNEIVYHGSNCLYNSGIVKKVGYIYVPSALVESYKTATNWSTYATQFRALEDYTVDGTITGELDPDKVNPHEPIEITDDWSTIMAAVDDGTYKSKYYVGDYKPLDLGSEGIVNMQIVAKDTDTLADGSGTAAVTWIAKELLATRHRMNPSLKENDDDTYKEGTGAIGGWEKSELRTYLKETIKPLIPSEVGEKIVEVKKAQTAYNTAGSSFTQETADDVWIPDYSEVYGANCAYKLCYPNDASRIKNMPTGSAGIWWLRRADSTSHFNCILTGGSYNYLIAYNSYDVALGFCTGVTK